MAQRSWFSAAASVLVADSGAPEDPLARLEQSRRAGGAGKKLRRENTQRILQGVGGNTPWEDRTATVRGAHRKALPVPPPRGAAAREGGAASAKEAADAIKSKVKAKAKAKKKAKVPLTPAEKKAKKLSKRAHVGRELVTGEKHYVEGLHECIEYYIMPLESSPHPLARQFLDRFEVSALFAAMKVLTVAAEAVLTSFERVTTVRAAPMRRVNAAAAAAVVPAAAPVASTGWFGTRRKVAAPSATPMPVVADVPVERDPSDDGASTWCFGEAVVGIAPLFASVAPYAAWVDSAMDVLDGFRKKTGFSALLQDMQAAGPSGLHGLESLIIAPVQRVARYGLLMKELLKQTPEDHADFEPLARALEAVGAQAGNINTAVGNWTNRLQLIRIQDALNGRGVAPWGGGGEGYVKINEAGRTFVRQGGLRKKHVTSLGTKSYWCHLFNDKLLLSSSALMRGAADAEELAAGKSRLDAPTMRIYKLSDTFELHAAVSVRPVPETMTTESAFELRSANKVIILSAENDRERDTWVRSLVEVSEHNREEEEMKLLADMAKTKQSGVASSPLERVMRCFGAKWRGRYLAVDARSLVKTGSLLLKTNRAVVAIEVFLCTDCLVYGKVAGMRSHMRPAEGSTPPCLEREPILSQPVRIQLDSLTMGVVQDETGEKGHECAFIVSSEGADEDTMFADSAAEMRSWSDAIAAQQAAWSAISDTADGISAIIAGETEKANDIQKAKDDAQRARNKHAGSSPANRGGQRRAPPSAPPRRGTATAIVAGALGGKRHAPAPPKRATRPVPPKRGSAKPTKLRSDGDWRERIDPTTGKRFAYNMKTGAVISSWEARTT